MVPLTSIIVLLLIVTGLVWIISRRGAGGSRTGDNLRDGQSVGGEGAGANAQAYRRSIDSSGYGGS